MPYICSATTGSVGVFPSLKDQHWSILAGILGRGNEAVARAAVARGAMGGRKVSIMTVPSTFLSIAVQQDVLGEGAAAEDHVSGLPDCRRELLVVLRVAVLVEEDVEGDKPGPPGLEDVEQFGVSRPRPLHGVPLDVEPLGRFPVHRNDHRLGRGGPVPPQGEEGIEPDRLVALVHDGQQAGHDPQESDDATE